MFWLPRQQELSIEDKKKLSMIIIRIFLHPHCD